VLGSAVSLAEEEVRWPALRLVPEPSAQRGLAQPKVLRLVPYSAQRPEHSSAVRSRIRSASWHRLPKGVMRTRTGTGCPIAVKMHLQVNSLVTLPKNCKRSNNYVATAPV